MTLFSGSKAAGDRAGADDVHDRAPRLELIDTSVSGVTLLPEWDARRSVFDKLAVIQAKRRAPRQS
jgi:hypothetical protein